MDEEKNPDLVEYISTTDLDALRSQSELKSYKSKIHRENHYDIVMSTQRSTHREIGNLYMVDAYD